MHSSAAPQNCAQNTDVKRGVELIMAYLKSGKMEKEAFNSSLCFQEWPSFRFDTDESSTVVSYFVSFFTLLSKFK